jgi:hypothetical protein
MAQKLATKAKNGDTSSAALGDCDEGLPTVPTGSVHHAKTGWERQLAFAAAIRAKTTKKSTVAAAENFDLARIKL